MPLGNITIHDFRRPQGGNGQDVSLAAGVDCRRDAAHLGEMVTESLFEKESKQKLSAYEVISRLEKKYCAPSWAFFTEVKSSVGFGKRRADGIAVAMWRSLGLEIHGFEVKCSRQDWLNELRNGEKSDEIFQYCDRWWVAVGDDSIVQDGELPPTWGLLIPHMKGLKIATKAPKLKPEPLKVCFIAEILRRQFNSQKRREWLELEYRRGFDAGKEAGMPSELQYEIEHAKKQTKAVEEFEKAAGLKIYDWNAGEVGAAVKIILECGSEKLKDRIQYARQEIADLLRLLDERIAAFKS